MDSVKYKDGLHLKQLIIISGNDITALKGIDLKATDILALSLPTMTVLDKNGIKFNTLEDYYPHENCYNDNEEFAAAHRVWLEKCDRLCQKKLKIDRAFSSNGFWFLHRLSDLYYIHTVLERLTKKYVNIQIISPSVIDDLPSPTINFSTLHFPFFGVGINHVMCFLKAGIPDVDVYCASNKTQKKRGFLGAPFNLFLKRLPEIIFRRGIGLLKNFNLNKRSVAEQYWVAQAGYDVDILKANWRDKRFHYILPILVNLIDESHVIKKNELTNELVRVSEEFINTWLPRYSKWLNKFILTYVYSVVLRLPELENKVYKKMSIDKPRGVFYSIGVQNVIEETIARVANKLLIPVYTFKHGGVENQFLLPSILDEYAEKNSSIVRTHFVHNQSEEEGFKNINNVRTVVVGVLDKPARYKTKNRQKILFSAGAPAHYSFKELRKMCSDYERYNFSSWLVSLCTNMKVSLDIKVHPAEWDVGYTFFKKLKYKTNESKNITILAGGSIERILNDYGLIVLDMISSRVLSRVLYLNVPIVVFIPKHFPVNQKYYEAFKKRVYIVHDSDTLEELLERFHNGVLNSKYDKNFQRDFLSSGLIDNEIDKVKECILMNEMNL